MEYRIPVNSIEQVFKAIFLTKEGNEANRQGIDTNGVDHYFYVSPVVINISHLESYYETPWPYKGKKILNVRTKSGDEWSLLFTLSEMLMLKKTSDFFNN